MEQRTLEETRRDLDGWTVATVQSGSPWRENGFVVQNPDRSSIVIVDPGAPAEAFGPVIQALDGTVTAVLLTHGHHDHVASVASLCRDHEVPCLVHEADRRLLRQAAMYGLRFAGRVIDTPKRVEGLPAHEIPLGRDVIRILQTPGHTPGSVTFICGSAVFTGDTLLRHKIGRTDLPGGDPAVLTASIDKMMAELRDPMTIFAGHGPTWTVAEARAWWNEARGSAPSLTAFEE